MEAAAIIKAVITRAAIMAEAPAAMAAEILTMAAVVITAAEIAMLTDRTQILEAQKTIITRLNKKSRVTKARFRKSMSMPINTMTATTRSHFN